MKPKEAIGGEADLGCWVKRLKEGPRHVVGREGLSADVLEAKLGRLARSSPPGRANKKAGLPTHFGELVLGFRADVLVLKEQARVLEGAR